MKVKINIGLNSCPLHWMYISRTLAYRTHGVKLKWSKVETGKYLGEVEETLVMKLKTKMSIEEFESYLEMLCLALNQECIAYVAKFKGDAINRISRLMYNPTYNGDRQRFDKNLFIK